MFPRPASAARRLYCSLPKRAARMKYHRCDKPEARNRGPGVDCASLSVLLEATESTTSVVPSLTGPQGTSLPLKEEPVSGHRNQAEASFLGVEDVRCVNKTPQYNDPSRVTDCFKSMTITDSATSDDQHDMDAVPPFLVTEGPMGKEAPTFLSCPVSTDGENPADIPTTSYLRSSAIEPGTDVTWTNCDVGYRKPKLDREYDDENEDDEEHSHDDENMRAHRYRFAGSIVFKAKFKRQTVWPGNQDNQARNRQLRLKTIRARRDLPSTQLIANDAVLLAPRSSVPIGELLSKDGEACPRLCCPQFEIYLQSETILA
ncbi:hypothetical protein MRX96_052956 [Rhipicephalus microplus]